MEARMFIEESLKMFIDNLSKKKGVSTLYFQNWKHVILASIDRKILYFFNKIIIKKNHNVLNNYGAMSELKKLQSHFILVPTDKAANNIYFVCKNYYANCIKNELGYTGNRSLRSRSIGSQTYEQIHDSLPSQIIDNHVTELRRYGLEVEEELQFLPNMYGSPKLHKSPIAMRYIIASK